MGKIVEAEMVPGAKRLILLKIDLGGEIKQSVAGIGEQYKPEDLKSKLVVVVTNLKPRRVFGLNSEVMLLAAVDGQTISVIEPDKQISAGSKVT
ncbi:MAG: hypothetical protein RMJ31_03055 [Nitrososphaerota archaeon]|nr:hypothetical protein [Nitrososphaerales archaeon]MDW8044736.1 hypothetical protein [Nitrososphaerota archaeon]